MLLSFDILKRNKEQLNSINVFPIADGDTGRNLCCMIDAIQDIEFTTLEDYLAKASDKALMSARGSSGNILSLYIMGLYQNYSENLFEMCKTASDFTWEMMYKPVEGTILTAMKDVPESYENATDFVYKFIQNTYNNLINGPEILSVLKENQTLDSGTLGFLYILCDIYKCMTGEDVSPILELNEPLYIIDNNVEDKYCVEITLASNQKDLKQTLSKMGSELIFLATNDKIKLHIHTDDYFKVIKACEEKGLILNYKIEDMLKNNERIFL